MTERNHVWNVTSSCEAGGRVQCRGKRKAGRRDAAEREEERKVRTAGESAAQKARTALHEGLGEGGMRGLWGKKGRRALPGREGAP